MPNATPDVAEKVEAALLGQVSEIADQVCDRMLVTRAAVPLKNRDGLGGPGDVVSFMGHLSPRIHNRSTMNAGSGSRINGGAKAGQLGGANHPRDPECRRDEPPPEARGSDFATVVFSRYSRSRLELAQTIKGLRH
jgi:hypothetical protein